MLTALTNSQDVKRRFVLQSETLIVASVFLHHPGDSILPHPSSHVLSSLQGLFVASI